MNEKIRAFVDKIPFTPLLLAYLASLGYQYYTFTTDPFSPLNTKGGELKTAQDDLAKLQKRVKETQEFLKSLDVKKMELRQLAQDLEDTKASLTESIDVPAFMKQVLIEAKKVGLQVKSLKPGETSDHEYYSQQVFDMTFTGAYVQIIGFMNRISNLQKIVRIDDFSLKTYTRPTNRYVELSGSMQLKAFRYRGSKADDLAKKGGPNAQGTPAGAKKAVGT